MLFRPNPSLGVPIYLQLMEQVKHAIETGALRPGDQLPGMRPLAEELVINPNTVAKAYRELEHEGVIELRHGAGAFVATLIMLYLMAVLGPPPPDVRTLALIALAGWLLVAWAYWIDRHRVAAEGVTVPAGRR